jgi:hypothetical protein
MFGWVIESQRRSWMGNMACMRGKDFGREPAGKRPLDGRIVLKRILKK